MNWNIQIFQSFSTFFKSFLNQSPDTCNIRTSHFNQPYQAVLRRVLHLAPQAGRTRMESFYRLYDQRLRNFFYPLERFLWNRRIL